MGSLLTLLGLPPPKRPGAGASQPPGKHGPSPEAARFTRQFAALMAQVAALEPARSPEAAGIRKSAVEAAKQATHAKGVASATLQLSQLERQVAQARAASEQAASAAAAATSGARLYTVKLGHTQLTNATQAQANKTAKIELDLAEARLKNGFETHCTHLKIARDEPFASWISSGISRVTGGQKMPALEIWDGARTVVVQARRALARQDIDAMVPLFAMIWSSTELGLASIGKYKNDTVQSAETAVKVLEKVKEGTTTVIVKAAGQLGGKGAEAAAAGMTAYAYNAAEQLSSVHLVKMEKEVKWSEANAAGITAFVTEMVGSLANGALAPRFSKMFGNYMSKAAISDQTLLRMGYAVGLKGPLPRDYLASKLQKRISAFVTAKAEGLVRSAVTRLASGPHKEDPSANTEEFLKKVVAGSLTDKAIDAFADFLVEHGTK